MRAPKVARLRLAVPATVIPVGTCGLGSRWLSSWWGLEE